MTGLPSAEKLAQLAALARATRAKGPPPMIARPIVLDERGYAWGICPDDPAGEIGVFLHQGLRVGWAPLPLQDGLLLSLWGGPDAEPGFEEEGVAAFFTRDGLRDLAADLVAIADASEPGGRL